MEQGTVRPADAEYSARTGGGGRLPSFVFLLLIGVEAFEASCRLLKALIDRIVDGVLRIVAIILFLTSGQAGEYLDALINGSGRVDVESALHNMLPE